MCLPLKVRDLKPNGRAIAVTEDNKREYVDRPNRPNRTALHCVALRCVALRCVALRCVALRCAALRCVALRCVALRCIALHCTAPFRI